jgi:hypothetical protein
MEALKAKVGVILETAARTGGLDESALAELAEALADQLRPAWKVSTWNADTHVDFIVIQ